MKSLKSKIMKAAKADKIPHAWSGLWYVRKHKLSKKTLGNRHGNFTWVPKGIYTYLHKITDSTLYNQPPGEIVMEDTPQEIETHMNFLLNAYGNVLVTGLGLGCVIRGLLVNPKVKFVTCIENSQDVLNLVEPYIPKHRVKIIHADALEWVSKNNHQFDCAWHDLYTDREKGEPHLQLWHSELLVYCKKKVNFQGAWQYPRELKRRLKNHGYSIV